MRHARPQPYARFDRVARAFALILASVHALVVTVAPLAERADTSVAPVHAEQAGTSTHHAHGELCAVCVASHLVAALPRVSLPPLVVRSHVQPESALRQPAAGIERLHVQPRAPPA